VSALPAPRLRLDSFGKAFGSRTVLKGASGLGLTWADFGTAFLEGRRVRGGLPRMSREGLFFLPDGRLLSPRLTVREHVTAVEKTRPHGFDPAPATGLRIERLLDSRTGELSGGERRRAEIWLAVAGARACLVADEPLLGISPADRTAVAEAFRARASTGTAILVTGHEVEELFDLADEVIWMVAGTTHGLGSPEEAARHPQFRLEYLGTRALT
jgi:ABC-type multidrug transport system ATPase subunit